jgi:hypothetical protein
MRGEIGFAGIAQGIGETMPVHRLQGFAAPGRVVAVVDDEERAALCGNAGRKPRHQTGGRMTNLDDLPRFARRGKDGFGVRRKAKAQAPFAI